MTVMVESGLRGEKPSKPWDSIESFLDWLTPIWTHREHLLSVAKKYEAFTKSQALREYYQGRGCSDRLPVFYLIKIMDRIQGELMADDYEF